MSSFPSSAVRGALVLAVMSTGVVQLRAAADDADAEIKALREEIRRLDDRLRQLEQKQQLKEQETAAAAKAAPQVGITDRGFTLASGDGANSVSIRGLVQFDSRLFFHDGGLANNSFLLRRARPIIEGTFGRIYSFQFVPEFGGTAAPSILDANFGVAPGKALQFKFGKFKAPVGLELLQSDSWTFFNERTLVTNLVPNRDIGAQVSGSLRDAAVVYAAGVFNGVADGASTTNADFDNDKDVIGRLWLQPWRSDKESPLQGLAFGAAAGVGREKTTAGLTAGYKTDGQQTFFKYRAGAVADGAAWRWAPQLDYRKGPFGAMAEYVISTVNARPAIGAAKMQVQNKAWQFSSGYVLTGESSSYPGIVPNQPFNWENRTWGAWEIVVRYANLKIDNRAFPLLADPAANANQATAVGFGVNWFLSRIAMLKFDYYQTKFGFNAAGAAAPSAPNLRQDEQALISRLQLSF